MSYLGPPLGAPQKAMAFWNGMEGYCKRQVEDSL